MPSSALGWRVPTTITEQGSCDQGLMFAQTVNGSPYSGKGVTNKLHEGIVSPFADVVGSRASSQGDVIDVPDGRLIGRWHPAYTNRWNRRIWTWLWLYATISTIHICRVEVINKGPKIDVTAFIGANSKSMVTVVGSAWNPRMSHRSCMAERNSSYVDCRHK